MYVYSYFAGWCNGSTSRSECETAGSSPDPATKSDFPPLFDAVKGGGDVNKKCRCFFNRFAALVAVLVFCSALLVPCFASNNAQWRKWVIVSERQMTNESGTMSKYFQLTPFQNGEIYAAVISSHTGSAMFGQTNSSICYVTYADNSPDWWRSSIPLGARSYVQFDLKTLEFSNTYSGSRSPLDSANLYVFDSNFSLMQIAHSGIVDGAESGGSVSTASSTPCFFTMVSSFNGAPSVSSSSLSVSPGQSYLFSPSDFQNVFFGFPYNYNTDYPSGASLPLSNLSSDRIVFCLVWNITGFRFVHGTAEISFWVDANKLPAGLQVGDEFPADTDAFDQLRDELLDQFPEASYNIQNGKDTIQGWNDMETVDSDVASTSISVLNAMFQNLGGFLFMISLMVFGAVVLRMLIRKAVDG